MKTILCPVDFTPVSDRLLQYVGNLASERRCKVYLVSTQVVKQKELSIAGSSDYGRLDKMHDYLSGIQRVPCGVVHETLTGNLYKKLGAIADSYDLMAIAMASSDEKGNMKGLDLRKIINETLAPVLTVPDRFQYHKINRLLYAYDYKHEPEPPLMQLHWLSDWFEADVLFITLYPGDTSMNEQEKLNVIHHAIKNSWKGQNQINFETIVYPNMPKGLEHYLKLSGENDLLVLSINHQNILERVWHKSIVNGVLQYSGHGFLTIHK